MNLILNRMLLLRDLEVYSLNKGLCGDCVAFMILVDLRRPSTLEDYPYLRGIEDENEFGRDNFIKVYFLLTETPSDELNEYLVMVAGGFLENKDSCDWNCDFVKQDVKSFKKFGYIHDVMIDTLNEILQKGGYPHLVSKQPPEKFNYLSQY